MKIHQPTIVFCLALLLLISSNQEVFGQQAEISFLSQVLDRGTVGRIEIKGLNAGTVVEGNFEGRAVAFFPIGNRIIGLFPADVMLSPGYYPLTITYDGLYTTEKIQIRDRSYGERSIKVPKSQQENLSQADIARAKREKDLVSKILATHSWEKLWRGSWIMPLGGEVVSGFGRQSRINGILNPRPHSGVDLRAKEGSEVRAPNDGVVLLCDFHFFAGGSVYVDHGQGIISMYFHLSDIKVKAGDKVKKGQLLALSGGTGRVSGPHLHYGIYFCGARIDPINFHYVISTLGKE